MSNDIIKNYVNLNYVRSSNEIVTECCAPKVIQSASLETDIGIFQNYKSCKIEKKITETTESTTTSSDQFLKSTEESKSEDRVDWNVNFNGFKTIDEEKTDYGYLCEKIVVELCPIYDNVGSIYRMMDQKVMIFGFNLFRDSIVNFKNTITEFNNAYSSFCQINNRTEPSSLFAVLSPRKAFTGYLKGRHNSFKLEQHAEVIVTADRRYASLCTKKIIYINATAAMAKLTNCSILIFGDVRLQVMKQKNLSAVCRVAYPGKVSNLMPVRLPRGPDIIRLSIEEMDDLKFIAENDIQIIVTPKPGCPGYLATMKEALETFKCNTKRLFTKVILETLTDCSRAIWIANSYDGFFVQVFETIERKERLIALKPAARCFLDNCYFFKKPLIFQDFFSSECPNFGSVLINSSDQEYFYYLPDKFLLPSKEMSYIKFDQVMNFLNIYNAERENFTTSILSKKFHDSSTTGSDTIAFSAVRSAYEVNASVIIVDSVSGMMAIKLSHFKPYCRIIAVTENKRLSKYLPLYHNVYVIQYIESRNYPDELNFNQIAQEKYPGNLKIIKKFRTAINFCKEKNFIENDDHIIFMFRSMKNLGYTNKVVTIKYDHVQLEEMLSKIN